MADGVNVSPLIKKKGLCSEILIIRTDKTTKIKEGINRCLRKKGTEKVNDLLKVTQKIGDRPKN